MPLSAVVDRMDERIQGLASLDCGVERAKEPLYALDASFENNYFNSSMNC
jgi:hypothetical protein